MSQEVTYEVHVDQSGVLDPSADNVPGDCNLPHSFVFERPRTVLLVTENQEIVLPVSIAVCWDLIPGD
jgi:hypothetical protein